ncbi:MULTISPECIES: ADP-ribosylglycohydrolase family protein [unclassified Pseudovibrio]|uniref:ADP-ribosylglycohydrolase family protein n=1 Tax=unclassified Pseudovibrio TaxID=2627060 RepID=UPI0007AEC37D|nr:MULTISPECIES: ADP-ribosylglycohydrolase family protein [unclassified Pseudovibrio]KZL03839.1 ADP-ribosylglycohydrolase [Pseudovibrio sp. W74]KZL09767.1 ADP-ribosylglycohydrolase [Pseudovibrio sp. Ad14]
MSQQAFKAHSLLGAFVADAASLGLHWLYDVDRIHHVTQEHDDSAAFVPLTPSYFEGVPAYFAHANRQDGQFTQYGENLHLALKHLLAHDKHLKMEEFQQAFTAHFGAGGTYNGYIDRPTRGTLENIANEKLTPSGVDDDQLPALSKIPAVLFAYEQSEQMQDQVEAIIRSTNDNEESVAYGFMFADLLDRVVNGEDLQSALSAAADAAHPDIQEKLLAALSASETDPVAYGESTGRACHLGMGVPLSFHILKNTGSYREAIEANILAGGDSAGRSILIGAVLGAVHGLNTDKGIPLSWILKVQNNAELWQECCDLTGHN